MLETGAFADAPGALWPLFALTLGLLIGSFANVCIHRLPLGESVVTPRSRCPSCRAPITAADNVPVFSYLLLRGRCRHCRAPISLRYPAVELANGLLYLAVALRDGPTLRALVEMAFVTSLLVLSLIDLDHQILPDVITIPGIAIGLVASVVLGGWPAGVRSALAAAGGYLAFWAVASAYRRTRGVEGLGQGDWKLAAMLGAFLGWERMLLTILLASLLGTIVGVTLIVLRRTSSKHPLPLGTFLGLAGVLVLFVGQPLVEWYGQLLRA